MIQTDTLSHQGEGVLTVAPGQVPSGVGCGCHHQNPPPPPSGSSSLANQLVSWLTCLVPHGCRFGLCLHWQVFLLSRVKPFVPLVHDPTRNFAQTSATVCCTQKFPTQVFIPKGQWKEGCNICCLEITTPDAESKEMSGI